MVSSLAAQLAQNTSLNAALLVDKSRRKPTESYLFTPKEAYQHDLDSIYSLGVNGFTRLSKLDLSLRSYEKSLFSDQAKALDRTLQPADVVDELNRVLDSFLPLLGPYLLENPTGRVLEWLVRRFRINEFNVQSVLTLFLPYHESPHFAKMLSILHISENSTFSSLLPFKTTTTPLSRLALVKIMIEPQNSDFSRFVAGILPNTLQLETVRGLHRGLTAFHTSTLLEFIKKDHDVRKGNVTNESTLAWYLPAASEPLRICAKIEVVRSKEALVTETILSSFLLLTALSHCCPLSSDALSTLIKLVLACSSRVAPKHLVRTLVALCAPQDNAQDVVSSNILVNSILKIPGVETEIKESLVYTGSEKLIGGILAALVPQLANEDAFKMVNSLVTHSELPTPLIPSITASLLSTLISHEGAASTELPLRIRSMLVHIQQRYPDLLQKAFDETLQADSEKKDALEQALLSLSMDLPGSSGQKIDSIVRSMSSESVVRAISVRELFEKLATGDVEDITSIRSALLTRVQDTNGSVLEALYSNAEQLLPIILEQPSAFINIVNRALSTSAAPGRNVVKAHITFVAHHLYPAISKRDDLLELRSRLIFDVILPFTIFSKSRQKTASAVWDIIETSEVAQYELLVGCVDAIKWESDANGGDALAKANLAVAARVAENIVATKSFIDPTATFMSRLKDEDPYTRTFSYLVVRSLLGRLSGEHKLDVGLDALKSMGLQSTESMSDFMKGAENVQEVVDDVNLADSVFHKPSSKHTHHRLQASILVMLPNIRRPAGLAANWLSNDAPADANAEKYMKLMKTLYNLSNTSVFPPVLAGQLLRATLINLGDDAMKFLASVWVNSDPKVNAEPAHYVALHHAAAFLEAHFATQHCIDFQTILPALLCSLQHSDRRVRGAALECIGVLVKLSQTKKPIAVYAYDAVYGETSDTIQYLDWADLSKYIQALSDAHEHILNDPSYLRVFQQRHLIVSKRDSKKDSGYKKRTLCYLLSHIVSCGLPLLKVSLLKSIAEISSPVKSKMLVSSVQSLSDEKLAATVSARFGALYEDYAILLASTFDLSAAEGLNKPDGDIWTTYVQVLKSFLRSVSVGSVRKVLAHHLQHGLFSALTLERKIELCHLLLELRQLDPDMSKECRDVLIAILTEEIVIIHLLRSLQPNSVDNEQRATKRAKVDSIEAVVEEKVTRLNAFADVLASSQLPGSLDLMVNILDTLTKLVHDVPSVSADKVFAEQLLLSAMENTAGSMPADAKIPATALRLDILVELIRVSENPQTFNQALLLMASLARLAPEAVLLNIMPIFTFMGSNVFHRDDSYSFRVVQKTIDSIVPVMISSLKASHSERFDLYIASRTFLRIFTDAANHIPRHRRTAFFGQLVDALDPQEFLAPICMLLVDKMANRIIRQNATDARNSLSLALTVLQRYPLELQLSALVEILREAHRSAANCSSTTTSIATFLELAPDDDRTEPSIASQRQAQSLLIFVDYAIQGFPSVSSADGTATQNAELLSSALDMANSKERGEITPIVHAGRAVVNSILSSMAATEFINGVQTVLQTGEDSVQQGALELLGKNLSEVKDTSRAKVTKVIVKIIDSIKKTLSSEADESLVIASFRALNAITATMCPGEESALTTLVPVIVSYIREGRTTASALDAMSSLIGKLGPRVIPYFKDIVFVSVNVFRSPEPTTQTLSTSVDILQGLLSSIPKFWSKAELTQVLNAYFESSSSVARNHTPRMSALIKVVAKKAPAKVLVPLMCEMWSDTAAGDDKRIGDLLTAYWTALKRTIRAAPRPVIAEHLRALFKTFLDAFSLVSERQGLHETVEQDAISTFIELVVKINEASFKPLFRKLFDWAFNSESGAASSRKLVFCHIFSALLDYFKGLMTPYMTFLLQPFIGILDAFRKESAAPADNALWIQTIQTIAKTFTHDDGVYWRNDKLRQLLAPLVDQLSVSVRFNDNKSKTAISDCLLGMAEVITDDNLLKTLNIDVLMNTRAEDSRLRCQALACSEAMWRSHGGKLLGLVSETITFVAEAAEDENDDVVRHALHLKDAIESVAGRIDV